MYSSRRKIHSRRSSPASCDCFEGFVDDSLAGRLQIGGDLPQFQAPLPQVLKPLQHIARQALEDLLQGRFGRLETVRSGGRPPAGLHRPLELGMRTQEPQIRQLSGRHIGRATSARPLKIAKPLAPRNANRFQRLRKAALRYFPSPTKEPVSLSR